MSISKQASATSGVKRDRFGNAIDPAVSYARGTILRSNADEIVRQRNTYTIARERREALGDQAIYNLTGLIRGFSVSEGDDHADASYVHFGACDDGSGAAGPVVYGRY